MLSKSIIPYTASCWVVVLRERHVLLLVSAHAFLK